MLFDITACGSNAPASVLAVRGWVWPTLNFLTQSNPPSDSRKHGQATVHARANWKFAKFQASPIGATKQF